MRWWGLFIPAAIALAVPTYASAACVGVVINTPQQLNNIRNNLDGQYCLARDLDLSGIANFAPIGDGANAFTGRLDGQGHKILNLRIRSNRGYVGLFGAIRGGQVLNLRLAGLDVRSQSENVLTGGLVGLLISGLVKDVSTAGTVTCLGSCRAGGIAGQTFPNGTVSASSSSVNVTSGDGGAAGGVTGQNNGRLLDVYATGRVTCGSNCASGGLTGQSMNVIVRAFASGNVTAVNDGVAGGLVGVSDSPISDAYATGEVNVGNQGAGGLVGSQQGPIKRVFSAGRIEVGASGSGGGLADVSFGVVSGAYWDEQTSTRMTSAAGTGRTTAQLRAALPNGFNDAWSITEDVTYPFLVSSNIDFRSTLATLVNQNRVFTFAPIFQREQPEYENPAPHARLASLAAVYGMIARGVGNTRSVSQLMDVKLDRFFWNDAQKLAAWRGPVTTYVGLQPLSTIAADDPLDDSNVVGALRAGRLVILRGKYMDGAIQRSHWLLATSFLERANGTPLRIVANDPWTGRQVMINPATKQVVLPAGFPLTNFQVNGYRIARIK